LIIFLIMLFAFLLVPKLASAMSATINIPEKYSEVSAGEKVYFETDIKWPENTERQDLKIEYSIKGQNGEELAYLKVLKAIETQASFMDSISIPESAKAGTYKIFLSIKDYNELNQEVAASFKIVGKKEDSFRFYLLIILGVVGLFAIIVTIELFILIRKKG
ncbi:MAG: hypothetical protein V1702_02980, partial [Candidatus Woesearchaeota archaeon]